MIRPRVFLEATRSATVNHPVPFLVSALLLFALFCFMIGASIDGLGRWLVLGSGMLCIAPAVFAVCYAMIVRPDLLRSERHTQITRYMDALDDSDFDAAAQARLGALISIPAEPRSKKPSGGRDSSKNDDDPEGADG